MKKTSIGRPFVNIGTEKSCLFISLSSQLINILRKNPFLYFATEESLLCANQGYYAAGILAFSQLLNCLNEKTPKERHKVAHEFLKYKPKREYYEKLFKLLENASESIYLRELKKSRKSDDEFNREIFNLWKDYTQNDQNLAPDLDFVGVEMSS
ncbi:MAG TPA: hypothetical protein PLH22_03135 [Candidatus Colwellbacteria bacterium]|nr:hypothetical protein [Candidatus Colwellbacteria bacterium]